MGSAALVLLLSLAGAVTMLTLSPHGVHTTSDSFTYLGAADRLASGEGWAYFPFGDRRCTGRGHVCPPLYPAVLAIPVSLGVVASAWALWQNALLLAIFATAVGMTVSIATRGNAIAVAVAVVLSLLGMPTIVSYSRIWSETFFLPFAVGVLASVDRYLVRGPMAVAHPGRGTVELGDADALRGVSRYLPRGVLCLRWRRIEAGADRLRAIAIYAVVALPTSAALADP